MRFGFKSLLGVSLLGVLVPLAYVINSQTSRSARIQYSKPIGGDTPKATSLFFMTPECDLGVMKTPVEHGFKFENRSTHAIRIANTQGSCSCAVTQLSKKVYEAGEKGILTVKVDPRTLRRGGHYFRIKVDYEGTDTASTVLGLRLYHQQELIVPEHIKMRQFEGQTERTQFELVDFRERPLKIKQIVSSASDLEARVVEEPTVFRQGWRYVIEATLREGNRQPGQHLARLALHTDDPSRPVVVVETSIERVKRVRVVPQTVLLQSVGSGGARTVFVDDTAGQEIEFSAIRASDPAVEYRVEAVSASSHRILVGVQKSKASFPPNGYHLYLTLSKPVREEICVSIVPPG